MFPGPARPLLCPDGMPLALLAVALLVVLGFIGVLLAGAVAAALHAVLGVAVVVVVALAYLTRAAWVGALAAALAVLATIDFVLGELPLLDLPAHLVLLPALALIAGALVFALGGLHYLVPALGRVGRAARLVGLACAALALLALGTRSFSGYSVGIGPLGASPAVLGRAALLCGIAAVAALVNHRAARWRGRVTRAEGPVVGALLALAAAYLLLPLPGAVFALLFNVVTFAMLAAAMSIAIARPDRRLLDVAGIALVALVLVRFAELAWPRLSGGAFALTGVALLAATMILHLLIRARTPVAQAA